MEIRSGEHERTQFTPISTEPTQSLMEVCVTTVVFTFDGSRLRVLGVPHAKRADQLVLPKHTFQSGMSLTDAANLAVKKEAGLHMDQFFQVGAFSFPPETGESPAVEVCFFSVVSAPSIEAQSVGKGSELQWVSVDELEKFDQQSIEHVEAARNELKRRARFESLAFYLLPHEFSLSELQKMFEAVLGRSIDVRNFRKKIDSLGILVESPNKPRGMAYRPPRLYSFSSNRFQDRLVSEGEIRFF